MKIVIFEPHPDDLLMGPGHILFDWIEEGHDIHVITVTDGRACYRLSKNKIDDIAAKMTEDEVANMRINEAKKTIEFLGLPSQNHHLLHFHDDEGQKYVKEGIEKVKPLIKDANRLFFPSNNNLHVDHQATYDIATGAARDLNLKDIEYWVFFLPTYGKFQEDSKSKLIDITLTEERKEKLQEWLQIYQSHKYIKITWKLYTRYLKFTKQMVYGIYSFQDLGKYYNF